MPIVNNIMKTHPKIIENNILPGHFFVLQTSVLVSARPTVLSVFMQLEPPCEGAGLSHARLAVNSPSPHVLLQVPFLQLPQFPLTEISRHRKKCNI